MATATMVGTPSNGLLEETGIDASTGLILTVDTDAAVLYAYASAAATFQNTTGGDAGTLPASTWLIVWQKEEQSQLPTQSSMTFKAASGTVDIIFRHV